MFIDFLLQKFESVEDRDALVSNDKIYDYEWLRDSIIQWGSRLDTKEIQPGSVVAVEADFSPTAVALLLALFEKGCIVVPLTQSVSSKRDEYLEIAEVEYLITLGNEEDKVTYVCCDNQVQHPLLLQLRSQQHPGLILFSSGSTGKSKAAVHDVLPLLDKFKVERHAKRTISFLLFDHIGGINTLLHTLANGGCVITVGKRTPDQVCAAIEKYSAQILPTSPTFLNLLLLSEADKQYDLSSLELITYGTEVMPESTLHRLRDRMPNVRLQQTYGLSEVGILRSKSKSSNSLWVKVGGEGFQTRIVDGKLEIRAQSAMLGYLNAPSPFSSDGWFQTGDVVEVDGEYIRILGRETEIINVGGEKVYPAEVESVLQLMDGVEDVSVSAEPSQITGQMVRAIIKLGTSESLSEFRKRMRQFCQDKLPAYKIPQKVILVDRPMHGERFKKNRKINTISHNNTR